MCPCNRECRTTTTAQMAGTLPLQLLLKDLLVAANRCACQDDPDPAAGVPRALSHAKRDAACGMLTTCTSLPRSLLLRSIRARDSHAHRVGVLFSEALSRHAWASRSSVTRSDPAIVVLS